MDYFSDLVQDTISGTLWKTEVGIVLTMGDIVLSVEGGSEIKKLAEGELVMRYAIPYLGMSHLSVIPSTFVSERGAVLTGWTGWNFGVGNYQLYPRSEFYGLRSDGEKAQVYLRELDFGSDLRVFAYQKNEDRLPFAEVAYLLYSEDVTPPPFLDQSLPPPPLAENPPDAE
jgi:hypothetical protein